MGSVDLLETIDYVDIGIDANTDLIRWQSNGSKLFRMDIMAVRATSENFFQHLDKSGHRTVFIKKCNITFTISAQEIVQYQLLEAILDEIILEFNETYGSICVDILGGITNMFEGFQMKIPDIFHKVQKEKVVYIRTLCPLCKSSFKVCVKKDLITKAKNYPVSIVYLHRGHGLLLYIDANFSPRGFEFVDITG